MAKLSGKFCIYVWQKIWTTSRENFDTCSTSCMCNRRCRPWNQLQYLTVLGVPIPHLYIQYQCLSLSMSLVWVLLCTNLWHISWWCCTMLHYSVPYCKYIVKSCYENHVSNVNITVYAFLAFIGNIDCVGYLHYAIFTPKTVCYASCWDMICYIQCNVVLF